MGRVPYFRGDMPEHRARKEVVRFEIFKLLGQNSKMRVKENTCSHISSIQLHSIHRQYMSPT